MKKIRWGLIGCGDISERRIAPALSDLTMCDLVAINRARFELAEAFAKKFGAGKWYATWQELIRDDEIDAVYIAVPVFLHAEISIAAAEHGKHVLCEKPMAMNVNECDRMIEACRANGVRLGVAYYRYFYPLFNRIRQIMQSGEIGKPVLIQVNAFENFNPKPGEPRYWLMQKDKAGGGPMFDFGCHRIEVLLHLFGPVSDVEGFRDNVLFHREVEDTAVAFFRFQSGSLSVLTVSLASMERRDTLDIFGSEGSIHVPVMNAGSMTVKTRVGERTETHPPHKNIHQPLIEDFNLALIEGREPVVNGKIGREVNRILAEIYKE
jgi:predicted dehydrogenase